MKISTITKDQWVSIAKNSVIAGLAAFATSLQMSNDVSQPALVSAGVAGVTAIIKVIEKAFTEA